MLQPNRAKHIKIRFLLALCILSTEYPCLLPKEFVAWVRYRVSSLDILGMHGHCLGFCLHFLRAIAWLFVYHPKRVHAMLQSTNLLWTPDSSADYPLKNASRHAHRPIVAHHYVHYFVGRIALLKVFRPKNINLWNPGRNGCHGARACCEEVRVASWKTRDETIDGSVFPATTMKGVVPKTTQNIKHIHLKMKKIMYVCLFSCPVGMINLKPETQKSRPPTNVPAPSYQNITSWTGLLRCHCRLFGCWSVLGQRSNTFNI